MCPFCRHTVTTSSLLALPAEESEFVEPAENPSAPATRSAKIEELIKYLKVFDTKDKTLVFSQFTSFLDLVAGSLKDAGIHFCRFDGSMNAKRVRAHPRHLNSPTLIVRGKRSSRTFSVPSPNETPRPILV